MHALGSVAATWAGEPPPFASIAALPAPVFIGRTIRIRPELRRALVRTARAPWSGIIGLLKSIPPRDLLAFAVWADTAEFLSIREVRLTSGELHPLSRVLRDLRRERSQQRIGALMIAQNEAGRIGSAIASVRQIVDEIVVVDGGSDDETAKIAAAAGAQVVERKFDLDFAAQRNFGLEHLKTDWVLWLDADEVIEPALGEFFAAAACAGDHDVVFAPRLSYLDGEGPFVWPEVGIRLFRRHLRYHGNVHEQVTGWKHALYAPASGPYVMHTKTWIDQHRASLLYSRVDPASYTPDYLDQIANEVRNHELGIETEKSDQVRRHPKSNSAP